MATAPPCVYDLFGALMLAVAGYSVVLLAVTVVSRRPAGWDVDVAHALMGVSMTGMFIAGWAFGPRRMWEFIFAVSVIWFLARSVQSILRFGVHLPHFVIHGVLSLTMVLMYAFPGVAGGVSMGRMAMPMPMPAGPRLDPTATLVLALCLIASAVFTVGSPNKGASHHGRHARAYVGVTGDGTPSGHSYSAVEGLITTPWVEDASHVAMCVAMGFLLILVV